MFYVNFFCLCECVWETEWNDNTHSIFRVALNRNKYWEPLTR